MEMLNLCLLFLVIITEATILSWLVALRVPCGLRQRIVEDVGTHLAKL